MVQSDGLVTVFSSDYISASLSNIVSGDTNLLSDDHKVPQCQTPPSRCQNRIAKYCQRKIFHINPMLKTVDEKKEKSLSRTIGDQQDAFTKPTLNYFKKLIKDAKCGFHSLF